MYMYRFIVCFCFCFTALEILPKPGGGEGDELGRGSGTSTLRAGHRGSHSHPGEGCVRADPTTPEKPLLHSAAVHHFFFKGQVTWAADKDKITENFVVGRQLNLKLASAPPDHSTTKDVLLTSQQQHTLFKWFIVYKMGNEGWFLPLIYMYCLLLLKKKLFILHLKYVIYFCLCYKCICTLPYRIYVDVTEINNFLLQQTLRFYYLISGNNKLKCTDLNATKRFLSSWIFILILDIVL